MIGYLGADARTHTARNGTPVTVLSLATQPIWKNRETAERESQTTWRLPGIHTVDACRDPKDTMIPEVAVTGAGTDASRSDYRYKYLHTQTKLLVNTVKSTITVQCRSHDRSGSRNGQKHIITMSYGYFASRSKSDEPNIRELTRIRIRSCS